MGYVSVQGAWGMEEVIVFDSNALNATQLETLGDLPDHDKFYYVKAIIEGTVMDETCEDCGQGSVGDYRCPNNREYCVDCCACPEHAVECKDCGEPTKSSANLCQPCFDQWLNQAARGGR